MPKIFKKRRRRTNYQIPFLFFKIHGPKCIHFYVQLKTYSLLTVFKLINSMQNSQTHRCPMPVKQIIRMDEISG